MPSATTLQGTASAARTKRHDSQPVYTPRPLSRGQRSRPQGFVYPSPRNQRVVTVAEATGFAYALLLEFNPLVRWYVERPRQLQLTPKTRIDVSFWSQDHNGEHHFHLLIPNKRLGRGTSGNVTLPAAEEMGEIARRNGLQVTCVTEADVMSSLQKVAVAYELLPLVWDSDRVPERAVIADQVCTLLRNSSPASLSNLANALNYPNAKTRSTVAWMVHQGKVRLVDYCSGAADAILELANG